MGGGQLGRMFAQAAQSLGFRVHVYEPAGPCPAGAVANKEVNASYEDTAALRVSGFSANRDGWIEAWTEAMK